MNVNRMRSSASSKLILGVVMAICFVVTSAHAQPRVSQFEGTFVLTNEVQWGNALLRPGTYTLAVRPVDAMVESIDVYNAATGKLEVGEIAAINPNATADNSQLLVTVRGNRRAVYSVQLAGIGEVLHKTRPFGANESAAEEARNVQPIPIESAKR
jgi:hypothetical protein